MHLPHWLGFRGKTLWDWLQLLIVPAILIAVTFAWSATQSRSDNKREDRRSQDATLQAVRASAGPPALAPSCVQDVRVSELAYRHLWRLERLSRANVMASR